MKFTKEEAVSKIKAKFVGKNGNTSQMISDRSITEQVDTLLNVGVVNDELELSDFVDRMAFPLCEVANNNLKKDNAEFVKNYKLDEARAIVAADGNAWVTSPTGSASGSPWAATIRAASVRAPATLTCCPSTARTNSSVPSG